METLNPTLFSQDFLVSLNMAALAIALLVSIVVMLLAIFAIRSIKLEFKLMKDLLDKMAEGSLKNEIPKGRFKESAEVFSVIERVANNLQHQREAVTILAFSDHLTNLANRVRFEDELVRGFNFAKRGLTIGVVLMRMDNFSKCIEIGGRAHGEHLLKLCGETLRQSIRKTDVAARFDADEFAIILANMDGDKIAPWLMQIEQRFIEAQRKDETLIKIDPQHLRFGYSFVQDQVDKDSLAVLERAHKALATTGKNSPIMSA